MTATSARLAPKRRRLVPASGSARPRGPEGLGETRWNSRKPLRDAAHCNGCQASPCAVVERTQKLRVGVPDVGDTCHPAQLLEPAPVERSRPAIAVRALGDRRPCRRRVDLVGSQVTTRSRQPVTCLVPGHVRQAGGCGQQHQHVRGVRRSRPRAAGQSGRSSALAASTSSARATTSACLYMCVVDDEYDASSRWQSCELVGEPLK